MENKILRERQAFYGSHAGVKNSPNSRMIQRLNTRNYYKGVVRRERGNKKHYTLHTRARVNIAFCTYARLFYFYSHTPIKEKNLLIPNRYSREYPIVFTPSLLPRSRAYVSSSRRCAAGMRAFCHIGCFPRSRWGSGYMLRRALLEGLRSKLGGKTVRKKLSTMEVMEAHNYCRYTQGMGYGHDYLA